MNDLTEVIQLASNKEMNAIYRAELRAKIHHLEEKIRQLPQVQIEPVHRFSDGVYSREITLPKGSLIVGAIHKKKNLNVISKGDVSFFSVDGAFRVQAPHSFTASPGVKRVIYAHEETVWTTIHGTHETDLAKIEDEFIAKNYSEIIGFDPEELKLIEEDKLWLGL